MSPSVVQAVDAYVAGFTTRSLPVEPESNVHIERKISRLGVPYALQTTHNVKVPRGEFGGIRKKTRAITRRDVATLDTLLASIKNRYAYLLQPSTDGSHYIIDLSSLHEVKMRKRYRSLGCTLHVTKDLSSVEVHPADTTTPETQYAQLAQVALSVYSLLKEAVVKLWSSIAPTFTTALTSVAQAVADALPSVAGGLATGVLASLTTSQRSLLPFQSGLGAFLEKIDKFLLSAKGILYHLTGMNYKSLLKWLKSLVEKTQLGFSNYISPLSYDSVLSELPVIKLGKEYYNHFATFIEDALKKGQLVEAEIADLTSRVFLPITWTSSEKLIYILWSLTYYHTLIVNSVQTTFSNVGSILTHTGQSAFEGIQAVIEAFKNLLDFKGTSLVAASDVLATPALARKFISLNELVQTDETYAEVKALAPAKVFLVPV